MTDTAITLTPSAITGSATVTASAALFSADDVGRLLSIKGTANARSAAGVVTPGTIFYADDRGVVRLYRVIQGGTTAAANPAGTTPDYDQAQAVLESGDVVDGTAILKYIGRGKSAWGWGTITAVADSTHCTLAVAENGTLANTAASLRWRLGEWGGSRGWPRAVTFFQSRTVWGGSIALPQTIWTSATGDFEAMSPTEPDGVVLDTNAVTITIDDDQVNTIRWLVATQRGIVAGTPAAPFTIGPASSTNGVLAPANVVAKRQSRRGSDANVAGAPVENAVLFMQRGGRKLREFQYDFSQDAYQTADLTILSEHITGAAGVVEAAYQEEPDGILWLVRDDGVLATLTYDREQQVRAWARQELAGGAVVESVAVVPAPDGGSDDVYVSVKRTISGLDHRWIEVIRAPFSAERDGVSGGFFVDSGLTYSGTPVTTFTGLDHLTGQTVAICADGAQRTPRVVVAGSISIGTPAASTVHIGLPYTGRVTTLRPEGNAAGGTSQGVMQRPVHATIRVYESGPFYAGILGGEMESIATRTPGDDLGEAVPLLTGDRRITMPGGWDRKGQITIESRDPVPLTVLGVIQETAASG